MSNEYTSHNSSIPIYARLTQLGDNGFWIRGKLHSFPKIGKKVYITKESRNGKSVAPEIFATEEVLNIIEKDGSFTIKTQAAEYIIKILEN